jgi:chaperone required for assembly of F1-ATPase
VTIKQGAKRAYATVSVSAERALLLDGKTIRSPHGITFAHPSSVLMEAIAEEWRVQSETLALDSMPFTRLLVATLELDASDTARQKDEIMPFVQGDSLRYFAPVGDALHDKQHGLWMPWLAWAEQHYGILWPITHHFTPPITPDALLDSVQRDLAKRSAEEILILSVLTQSLASCIMATALIEGACSAEEAVRMVWLEYDHQAAAWGQDVEISAKKARIYKEVRDALQFLTYACSCKVLPS